MTRARSNIGYFRDDNASLIVDLDTLVETRLLIQASSGGGKSNAIRLIAEAAAGKVQTLIIDREGELHTLAETIDLLVVGDSGALPVNPRNAGELAVELLKSGVSAVVDLLGVTPRDQKLWVRRFVENLNAAPKSLWHPVLVIIDEAHVFCPERGQGEAESGEAIELLMSAGRKRGYCGVLATQRISVLSKTAAAEANNKAIGLTNLDVDYKRAGAEIGLSREDATRLMHMQRGQFYVRGPAFGVTTGYRDAQLDQAKTRPPKRGSSTTAAAPSAAILAKLPALEAIGKASESDDVHTIDAARALIKNLRGELAKAKRETKPGPVQTVADPKAIERAVAERDRFWKVEVAKVQKAHGALVGRIAQIGRLAHLNGEAVVEVKAPAATENVPKYRTWVHSWVLSHVQPAARQEAKAAQTAGGITARQQRFLDVAASLTALNAEVTRETVCGWLGVHPRGGSVGEELAALEDAGLIRVDRGRVDVTDAGRAAANHVDQAEALERSRASLTSRQRRILEIVCEKHPESIARDHVAGLMGIHPRGGSFGQDIAALKSRGLIDADRGQLRARDFLFAGGTP